MTRDQFLDHVAHRADIPLDAAETRAGGWCSASSAWL
jgi:hypothetical protein